MESFRTVVSAGVSKHTIGLNDQILTLGSCFSDAMGNQFANFKIKTLVNPLGTIYNPVSIHKAIDYGALRHAPTPDTFVQNQDIVLNYDFHSTFSALSQAELEERLKTTLAMLHHFLKDCEWLMITYGTAWVYERSDTGEIVANCHKMPASRFSKVLLTEQAIVASFDEMYGNLLSVNPSIKIILTVSPVRHLKDTLELNSVSKAILRVACHTLAGKFENVEYFPAYEIMMDDLRDYRFYKPDMIHPTGQAEEYIWEKFIARYTDASTRKFFATWKSIRSALQHKPFHPTSAGHQIFLKQTIQKLEELKNIVNVDEEVRALQALIVSV